MSAVTHVGTVIVPVADQDAALAFYTGTLGFEMRIDGEFAPGQRWLEVAPPGAATTARARPGRRRRGEPSPPPTPTPPTPRCWRPAPTLTPRSSAWARACRRCSRSATRTGTRSGWSSGLSRAPGRGPGGSGPRRRRRGLRPGRRRLPPELRRRREIGAACAVYRDGRKVVDLWGGYRDGDEGAVGGGHARPGVLHHQGRRLDGGGRRPQPRADRLRRARGELLAGVRRRRQGAVTVRQLLSHQAGLCAIDEPLSLDDLLDLDRVAEVIAAQKPPGSRARATATTGSRSAGTRASCSARRPAGAHARALLRRRGRRAARDRLPHRPARRRADAGASRRIHGYQPAEMLLHLHEFPPASCSASSTRAA